MPKQTRKVSLTLTLEKQCPKSLEVKIESMAAGDAQTQAKSGVNNEAKVGEASVCHCSCPTAQKQKMGLFLDIHTEGVGCGGPVWNHSLNKGT